MTQREKRGFKSIGSINGSAKIQKTDKVLKIGTYVSYLAPSTLSGKNVCPMATKECIAGCLNTSGRAIMDTKIGKARVKRTRYFFNEKQAFNSLLFKEIASAKQQMRRKRKQFAVRLNGTSDISPIVFRNAEGKNVFETFPDVQFYDYTKVLNRIKLTQQYPNYDLTFSYTGHNWDECVEALNNGVRVAVIFNVKGGVKPDPLPTTFRGYKVIDGDKYDYRVIDAKNVIVGLRWKRIKNKAVNERIRHSAFVEQV